MQDLLPLFDGYRKFYGQESDLTSTERFLKDRFEKNENAVFIAYLDGIPVGFTQLYTTFSSVTLEPYYILNDLYVHPDYREKGIAKDLLKRAKEQCRSIGYKGLALETANDNPAQKLYEKLGWKKDSTFLHYFWKAN